MIYQPFRAWLTNWQSKICLLYIFLGDCYYHDYARRWWSKGWRTRTTPTGPGLGKTNWEWTPWSWSGGESCLARPAFRSGYIALSRLTTFIAGTSTKSSCKKTSRRRSPIRPVEQSILRLKNKYFLCQSHNVFDENKLSIMCKPFFLKNEISYSPLSASCDGSIFALL